MALLEVPNHSFFSRNEGDEKICLPQDPQFIVALTQTLPILTVVKMCV
jgi:hypothetical protein